MPTIVPIVISRETGEGLIGRRGGSTIDDVVYYLVAGFVRLVRYFAYVK